MDNKIPNIIDYTTHDGRYKIDFYGYIYNDYRDGITLEKITRKLLNPEIDYGFGGLDDISGSFVKDDIHVYTCWHSCYDYFWEIHTTDEAVKKRVYEWATKVYMEYRDSEKS